ncbi:MAG: UDP-4-amino-4,6-dideoxy-N-acetyl-beta-L-altrosamine transaminase [candidate division NC10 bacterium]|nr:UDP-4-amino-4,6-dideoxy-N-acetyl-beta-L-altrosamine transaminase [candidate division NC10 bacterium]
MGGEDCPALFGGRPVRERMLPYGRHEVDEADIRAVVEVLRGDWLTNGPTVARFEQAFAQVVGARFAAAFSSGTAALHAAAHAAGIQSGDEVITSPLTFLASANCILYCGANPVFADVDPETLNLNPAAVEAALTPRTKAILPVHFAGLPCAMEAIYATARSRNLLVIEDAAHALGAEIGGRPIGSLSELTTFSFHPVKHITTGEGGMVTTSEAGLAERLRRFRNHGIDREVRKRQATTPGAWRQEMVGFGVNYRLTDLQSALGLSQLRRLDARLKRREEIAARYQQAFAALPEVRPAPTRPGTRHAWHIYPLRLNRDRLRRDRETIFQALRAENIGVSVHYQPVHLHPYYRERLGTGPGLCPAAEAAFEDLITLPLFPGMSDGDVADVIHAVEKVMRWARK